MLLDRDDHIRRDLISQLICNLRVDKEAFAARWKIAFDEYFARELARLAPFIEDGLLTHDARGIDVLTPGRLLVRNICMAFDRYRNDNVLKFSRTI